VVFASVVEGYDVVKKIEDVGTNSGKPKDGIKVEIVDCGVLDQDEPDAAAQDAAGGGAEGGQEGEAEGGVDAS
jgi:cyclophilin family peptidyl-prolyl cis-trans isomerase